MPLPPTRSSRTRSSAAYMRGAFTPFGYHASTGYSHMAFAGQRLDGSSSYLLGNGRRAYDPVLMRFRSPDTLSPMGAGGINTYVYCANDPVNRVDPSGRAPLRQAPLRQSMITQSDSSGAIARHYSARGASALGSLAGVGMAFGEIAVEHMQLQRNQPDARFSAAHRARRIAGFYALFTPTVADTIEVILPPEAAGRVGLVDNLGLASAGFFMAEAGIALFSTIRTEGFSGLVPTARSTLYALGEVTLVGPARDFIAYANARAWNYVYENILSGRGGQRTPANAANVIRMGELSHQ
nr:RHS repeat-associated core domain-containing protein [Pseudomonas sp.]